MVLNEELGLATKIGKKFSQWEKPREFNSRLLNIIKDIIDIEEIDINKGYSYTDMDGNIVISWKGK